MCANEMTSGVHAPWTVDETPGLDRMRYRKFIILTLVRYSTECAMGDKWA